MRTFTPRLLMLAAFAAAACDSTTGTSEDASFPSPDSSVVFGFDGATSSFEGGLFDAGNAFDAGLRSDGGPGDGGAGDGGALADAGDGGALADAALGDAGTGADAGDAGGRDAGTDAAVATGPGVCGGTTPHGCWKPKAGNDVNCPPQIHEQSALYPPANEWVACSSPYYQACIYLRPDGTEANCSCDLGLHWLCAY